MVPPIPICGFGHVILYIDSPNYQNYLAVMRNHPKMLDSLSEKTYGYRWKSARTLLNTSTNYRTKDSKQQFLDHFSIASWVDLSENVKSQHQFQHCTACNTLNVEFYNLLNRNAKIQATLLRKIHPGIIGRINNVYTAADGDKSKALLIETVAKCGEELSDKYGKDLTITLASKERDQSLVNNVLSKVGEELVESNNIGILSHNASYNQQANINRRSTHMEKESSGKVYSVKHERFAFNREAVRSKIQELIHEQKDINYQQLSREYEVHQSSGKLASNGNQVIRAYAESVGLVEPKSNRRVRRGKRKLEVDGLKVDLTKIYPTSSALKEVTKKNIVSGLWDIGSPIVPITLLCKRIEKGRLVSYTNTMHGRAFTLQKILDRALVQHEKEGLLRQPFALSYDIADAKTELADKGIYSKASSIEELNKEMTTRRFMIWHDHSTVASHSHFLALVSLIYDPLVFKTSEEYEGRCLSVDSVVEQPHVYISARSKSTTKDQVLYTPTRVEHLLELGPSTTTSGVNYQAKIRLGIGDSPARAFESGNQVNGHYPCSCGIDIRVCKTHMNFLKPKYIDLVQRLAVIDASDTWKNRRQGVLSVYDLLDVNKLRQELTKRGVPTLGHNKAELREKLDRLLSGVRRPIALLANDDIELILNLLSEYAIAQLEPLHDLKTTICNIIKELTSNSDIPKSVRTVCVTDIPEIQAHKFEINGYLARRTLIRLTLLLQETASDQADITSTESECVQRIIRLLYNLCYIQELAYAKESRRTAKNILALHNLTYVFFLDYKKLFNTPQKVGPRAMFGMPFHSITAHFAEWYRIISLRSLNAENQERFFKDIKSSTLSTNYHHDHLLTNSIIRLQVKADEGVIGKSYTAQENDIVKEWKDMPTRPPTIITRQMIEEDVTSYAAHKVRIADFLQESVWHTIDEVGTWTYADGEESTVLTSIQPMHFRSHTIEDVWGVMEQSFELYKAQQLAKLDGSEDYLHSPVDDMETHTINHSEDDTEPEILSLELLVTDVADDSINDGDMASLDDSEIQSADISHSEVSVSKLDNTPQENLPPCDQLEKYKEKTETPSKSLRLSVPSINSPSALTPVNVNKHINKPEKTETPSKSLRLSVPSINSPSALTPVNVNKHINKPDRTVTSVRSPHTPKSDVKTPKNSGRPALASTPVIQSIKNHTKQEIVLRKYVGEKLANELLTTRRGCKANHSQQLSKKHNFLRSKVAPLLRQAKVTLKSKLEMLERTNVRTHGFVNPPSKNDSSIESLKAEISAINFFLYY